MAFIYNLTDTWNDVATTWNGIKLAVTDSGSSSSSKLLNLTISGSSTGSFTVDKSGNLLLSGSVNKITMTAPATGATLTLDDGSTFATSGAYSSTFTFTGATTLTFPTSGTVTALGNTTTGSGSIVLATSPTLTTPALGTPSALTLTNATGLPISTGLTGTGTGVLTALAVNVGSAGAFVTFNGALGTPSSGNLTNCTGISPSNISGLGTGVATALANNVGSAGAFVVNGGALGTPSSGTLTNATGLPIGSGVSGLGTGVATFLATPSSANLASAVTDETGSGSLVFSTAPTFGTNITVGTASSSTGIVNLKGTTSGTVALSVADAAGSWTMKLPTTAGTNGYYLQTDGLGNTTWAAGGGGGGGSPGGSSTQIQYNNAGAFGGSPAFTFDGTTTVGLGVASTTTGIFNLYNLASANAVSIKSGNNASAWTLTLPTSAGTNNYALLTDGSGVTSWGAVATGTINTGTVGQITYYSGTSTLSGTTTGTGVLTALGVNTGSAGSVVVNGGALGTPSSGTLTSCTGLPLTTGVTGTLPVANGGTGLTAGTSGGVLYYSATGTLASSAALAANALVVGGGAGIAPSTVTTGTGVVTALGVNTGSAGAFVVNGGALGTPSSGTLTSCTGLPISTGVSGLGANVATFLATPSSANLAAAVTDETGSGALVFGTSPTFTTSALFPDGSVSAPSIAHAGDTNCGFYFSTDTISAATNGTNALTIDSSQNVSVANTLVMGSSFLRNRVINGNMQIDQRNAGASVTVNTAAKTYGVDRFFGYGQASDGVFTIQQSTTAPAGFINSTKITVTTADSSVGASQYYFFGQVIEGKNIADLNWGSANAKTITLSFWVYSSLTGTFGGALSNSAADRSYPFTYSISSANTWEKKTVTISGDTSGTWLTTAGIGVTISFDLGCGSSNIGTAGAWAAGGYYGATGDTKLISTLNATLYFTGVQFEVGSIATSFEARQYGEQLSLCQRYFEKNNSIDTAIKTASTGRYYVIPATTSIANGDYYLTINYMVTKRATAGTITIWPWTTPTNTGRVSNSSGTDYGANSALVGGSGEAGFNVYNGSGGALTVTQLLVIGGWAADAEL